MKTLLSDKWVVGIGTAVIASAIVYLLLPSSEGIRNNGNVSGSIQTVGQTGGTNIINDDKDLREQIEYSYVATLDALGKSYEVTYPLISETPISKILSTYIHMNATNTTSDCSDSAMRAFRNVISLEPKFPFSYYFLATCEKLAGSLVWKSSMLTALNIFQITTQIAGHNVNHDQALNDIHTRFNL